MFIEHFEHFSLNICSFENFLNFSKVIKKFVQKKFCSKRKMNSSMHVQIFFWTEFFFVLKNIFAQRNVQMNVQTCSLDDQWTKLNIWTFNEHVWTFIWTYNEQIKKLFERSMFKLFIERSNVFKSVHLNTLNIVHWTKSLETLRSRSGSRTSLPLSPFLNVSEY